MPAAAPAPRGASSGLASSRRSWAARTLATLLVGGAAWAGCAGAFTVPVRPATPSAARLAPPATETVGLLLTPDFGGRREELSPGLGTFTFELGRGGAPMVREIVQARFARVLELPHAPPLAPAELPEVQAVLVPSWRDMSLQQTDELGTTNIAVVLDLALLRRDGSAVWSKTFSGQGSGLVNPETGGIPAYGRVASAALEQLGAALAEELTQPTTVASVAELREQASAAAAAEQQSTQRQQARRLYVHPFAGSGPVAPQAGLLQGEVVSRLLGSGRFVAVATAEQQAQLDAAVRDVNRESVNEQEWVRLGQGRGAEQMLSGQLASAGAACSIKVELTDLSTRLVLSSFFRTLNPCTVEAVQAVAEPAAQGILGGQ